MTARRRAVCLGVVTGVVSFIIPKPVPQAGHSDGGGSPPGAGASVADGVTIGPGQGITLRYPTSVQDTAKTNYWDIGVQSEQIGGYLRGYLVQVPSGHASPRACESQSYASPASSVPLTDVHPGTSWCEAGVNGEFAYLSITSVDTAGQKVTVNITVWPGARGTLPPRGG